MKVLYVITRAERGGAQSHVFALARAAAERGEVLVASGEDGPLCEDLRSRGLRVRILPDLRHAPRPWRDGKALIALIRLIREFRPQLVHGHSGKAGLLARLAAHSCRVPAVYTAHGYAFTSGPSWRRLASYVGERIGAATAATTIAVSESERRLGEQWGIHPRHCRVVHNGCDEREEKGCPQQSPPVIVMVARFAMPKQQELLLRAFGGVQTKSQLWLVGDGPRKNAAQSLAEELGIASRVKFWGDCADVPNLLTQAQIAALISAQEGFGLSLIEAMAAGLPVIASDVGGMREIVRHGTTGWLVEPGSEAALRSALQTMLSDAGMRATMGQAGLEHYREHFTESGMLAKTFAAYDEAIRLQARGPGAGYAQVEETGSC